MKRWNNILSLFILVGLPVYWVFGNPSETISGTTLGGWLLVVQYYFRKAPPEEKPDA